MINETPKMQSKNKSSIRIIAAVLLGMLVLLVFTLIATKNSISKESAQMAINQSIDSVFSNAKEGIVSSYYKEHLSVKVDSVGKNSDGYFAECAVSVPDLYGAYDYLLNHVDMDEDYTYQDIEQMVVKNLESSDPTITKINVLLNEVDSSIVPVYTQDDINILMGGLYDMINKLIDEAGENE